MDALQNFIKREKIRTKKLLSFFQKNKKKYIQLQKEGIWVPFASIDSVEYFIKVENLGETFNDEWDKKFEYEGFNLDVSNGIWISDVGSFLEFDENEYQGEGKEQVEKFGTVSYYSNTERWYTTLDGEKIYTDFWYDIPSGKYLLTIKGYARKEIVDRKAVNYGFQFVFKKVDEFDGYKNPREEQYNFNVASMK
ncbi:MAG: hypothetical protein IJA32_05550 [Lachnospiraceae bacterium]|nr:hypothetical protein [Lachnospiraceae bacterium]